MRKNTVTKLSLILCLLTVCLSVLFIGCDNNKDAAGTSPNNTNGATNDPANTQGTLVDEDGSETIEGIRFTKVDLDDTWDETAVKINLNGEGVEVNDQGVTVTENIVTIKAEGSYIISGTLNDGQIRVEVDKTVNVQLILNNASITCKTSSPIYIVSANKAVITLAEGTTNTLTDGLNYVYSIPGETKPNACVYSSEDLTINGKGSLIVKGNYNNGIGTINDFKIVNGNITVNAVKNALRGTDSVSIKGGTIELTAGNDGIKSTRETKEDKGSVNIFGGTINIKAEDDSIQAYAKVNITGGKTTVKSMGKDINCDGEVKVADNCLVSVNG